MFCETASGLYLLRLALRQSATHISAPPTYFLGSALVKRSRKHPLIGICSLRQALFSLAFTDRGGHTFFPVCPSFLSSLPPPRSLSDCLCSCQSKETLPLALRLPRLQEKKNCRDKKRLKGNRCSTTLSPIQTLKSLQDPACQAGAACANADNFHQVCVCGRGVHIRESPLFTASSKNTESWLPGKEGQSAGAALGGHQPGRVWFEVGGVPGHHQQSGIKTNPTSSSLLVL